MNVQQHHMNEQHAAAAFSRQSVIFDQLYSGDTIVQYKRERVRQHLQTLLKPGSHILELNSGTGEDAIWMAQQGYYVHATDIATGMQEQLLQKVKALGLQQQISNECISFTQLDKLQQQKKYDHIFSNFAGLNCTGQLDKVLQSFNVLLKPGGTVTLVILPKFCLWEFLLLFKGQFKTAFRRLFSRKGVTAHVEGAYFTCWYYNPSYVIKHLEQQYKLIGIEGLCTIVPPSYMEGFAEKNPRLYNFLQRKEAAYKTKWPWRSVGDYYIISFRKKDI
ncbi:MAG: methyltransferase domain-containing protein [Bacteroidota bacterium]